MFFLNNVYWFCFKQSGRPLAREKKDNAFKSGTINLTRCNKTFSYGTNQIRFGMFHFILENSMFNNINNCFWNKGYNIFCNENFIYSNKKNYIPCFFGFFMQNLVLNSLLIAFTNNFVNCLSFSHFFNENNRSIYIKVVTEN